MNMHVVNESISAGSGCLRTKRGARLCDFTFKCHVMIPDCVIVYPCVVSFCFYVYDEWSDCASVVSECVYISLGVSSSASAV